MTFELHYGCSSELEFGPVEPVIWASGNYHLGQWELSFGPSYLMLLKINNCRCIDCMVEEISPFNPSFTSGPVHSYHLDESISSFRDCW